MSALCISPDYFLDSGTCQNSGVSNEANKLCACFEEISYYNNESIILSGNHLKILNTLTKYLKEFADSNWDGYGAMPIDKGSYSKSISFSRALPKSLPLPELSIEPDGEVAFEWYNSNNRVFSVSIGSNGELAYAGLFGLNKMHGTEYFEEGLPKTILEGIQRVFSK